MNTRNIRFKSNRVGDILGLYHEELDSLYGNGEVGVFLDMLFDAFLGWNKVRLLTSRGQTIDQSDLLRFHWALEDLKRYRPIQHIIGHTDFCGCRIAVSPDVLIPRPETEEMVNWIVESGERKVESVLDLCTGSGCIAIALKTLCPESDVTAVDVSEKALSIAKKNAVDNNTIITILHADLLASDLKLPTTDFKLIVSNPPYVRDSERTQMRRNVLDYDPALALFVPDDDPLLFYRAIAKVAKEHLAPDGLLVVEINESLSNETCNMFCVQGFCPVIHRDFRGKPRWVSAVWNP